MRYTRPYRVSRRPIHVRRDSVRMPHDEFTGMQTDEKYLAEHTSEITGNRLYRDVRAQKGSWDLPGYHGPLPAAEDLQYFESEPDPRYE